MDRAEYKTKLDEVAKLISDGNVDEGLDLLDTMNWRKVRNVNVLLQASEIYEAQGRYQDARELLELAHERSPIGRMIIYRLALLCIVLDSYTEAKEYYQEFVEIAPHDSLQYIISYKLAKAQGAEDITLISILEELKEHDFLEEWAYELALLYHKTGQVEKCISVCDELILWYGDGPYVESAMELKMVYQPLDEQQETKYRYFRQKRDGITEVKPGEEYTGGKGEILNAPIEIPEVALSTDRFNTQNLQEEIKKNIKQIMKATEADEVDDKMEGIKELVEEIPYVKTPKDATGPVKQAAIRKQESERIDDTLRSHFKEYLAEEYDGQISFDLPDIKDVEPQIAGQMTIDQIMSDWQKTARAAEAALAEANEQELENAKAKAIEEANQIIDRLEEAKDDLDAGVTPKELLKKEYLEGIEESEKQPKGAEERPEEKAKEKPEEPFIELNKEELLSQETRYLPAGAKATYDTIRTLEEEGAKSAIEKYATKRIDKDEVEEKEKEALEKQSTFKIPKIDESGSSSGVGFEVPILETAGKAAKAVETVAETAVTQEVAKAEEGVSIVDKAAEMMADVNDMLKREIESVPRHTNKLPDMDVIKEDTDKAIQESKEAREKKKEEEAKQQTRALAEAVVAVMKEQEDSEDNPEDAEEEEVISEDESVEAEQTDNVPDEEDDVLLEVAPPDEDDESDDDEDDDDIEITEEAFSNAIYDELPQTSLTKEEKELFTYFTPIAGMETALCQVLTGARARLRSDGANNTGNIIIQGGDGSGKTTLATSLIQVLQMETGRPNGNVGRIDGDRLNGKDLSKLFSRIRGGCLIIEHAGEISRECALELSAQMEQDETGILVILEDVRTGIERVMALNPIFSRKFTEKLVIPVMTIDELANFGKAYAFDLGYSMDEMGVLAMYDRINLIQRFDHPTNLTEVKEIVDEAIDVAESGGGIKGLFGRFGSRRYDDAGNLILQEKDFQGQ